ncbi:MAG: acetylglutamate kinase [Gemmatimonadetes bacterium]|nr:acetylglutamate kinase [Gemmatimonadota bacterium]
MKIGGRAQRDPHMIEALATAFRAGESLCLVHGGGDEVSALQRRLGMESTFLGGRRVTSADDLEVVRMVLSGGTNKRIVAQLITNGVRAVGVSGEDAALFRARVTDPKMGRVGSQVTVDPALVIHLMQGGYVPVISPLARDADAADGATGLNVNGDDAAAALAGALNADDLVLVADVPGVLDGDVVIPTLDVDGVGDLIARGIAEGGMAAKLEAGIAALRAGVRSVRIAGVDGIGDLNAGTRLLISPSLVR